MEAQIFSLPEIAAACRPFALWWDGFVTTGQPCLAELERARRQLGRLLDAPGSIGRAVRARVAAVAPPDVGSAELLRAVEVVCRVAEHAFAVSTRPRPTRPARSTASAQLVLPGIG